MNIPSLALLCLLFISANGEQTSTTSSSTLESSNALIDCVLGALTIMLPLLRNLILIGTVFNLSEAFLPFILFSESLLMLGFWPENKNQLDQFFKNALNSKIDIMGVVRQGMSGEPTDSTPAVFANVGYTDNAFLNISGQVVFVIIFLALTVLVKLAGSFCRNEKARRFGSKLRCRWNGFFMGLLPRLATLSTLHLTSGGGGNIVVAIVILALLLAFWIQLFLHLRWVVEKPDMMMDRYRRVGLLGRISLKGKFEFDCLEWSNVHFPLMNYTRLLVYFLLLGLSPSSIYFSYAGPILSQLLIIMIQVSSPGYFRVRDRILYPIYNFLLMLVHIAIIVVVLGQSVSEVKACVLGESVMSALLLTVYIPLVAQTVIDTIYEARDRWKMPKEDQSLEIEPEATFREPTEKVEDLSSLAFTKSTVNPKLKIKKVRRGRVI